MAFYHKVANARFRFNRISSMNIQGCEVSYEVIGQAEYRQYFQKYFPTLPGTSWIWKIRRKSSQKMKLKLKFGVLDMRKLRHPMVFQYFSSKFSRMSLEETSWIS